MNKFIKGLLYTLCYLVLGFITLLVFALSDAPAALFPLVFILPAVILLVFAKRNSLFNMGTPNPQNTTDVATVQMRAINDNTKRERLPSTRRCREIADACIDDAKQCLNLAHRESSISLYFAWGDQIREKLGQATKYEEKAGYSYTERPSYRLKRFEDEFQWKLRDAIEREEENLIKEILGPQHNNKRACCQDFLNEIEFYKGQFSEETLEYAMNAYFHVCSVAGLSVQKSLEDKKATPMELVDRMEGHEFEYYCADLLSKNGFRKVEVTKGSGDQGIDILAEKDDIKYAIQCKCYSSDLGNKPVQEAFAGKSIYNCQVAAVLTNRFFTQGAKEAAEATGVLLWDRNKLQSFINNENE